MLTRSMVQQVLDSFASKVVKAARLNLGATRTIRYNDGKTRRARMVASGKLQDSIQYDLSVKQNRDAKGRFASGNNATLSFEMEEYGKYLDEGVSGVKYKVPGGSRFGYTNKRPPVDSIRDWMDQRNFRLRDLKTGKFIPSSEEGFKSAAFAISKKIYERGLPKTMFFQTPFQLEYEQLPDEIVKAFADDLEQAMNFVK